MFISSTQFEDCPEFSEFEKEINKDNNKSIIKANENSKVISINHLDTDYLKSSIKNNNPQVQKTVTFRPKSKSKSTNSIFEEKDETYGQQQRQLSVDVNQIFERPTFTETVEESSTIKKLPSSCQNQNQTIKIQNNNQNNQYQPFLHYPQQTYSLSDIDVRELASQSTGQRHRISKPVTAASRSVTAASLTVTAAPYAVGRNNKTDNAGDKVAVKIVPQSKTTTTNSVNKNSTTVQQQQPLSGVQNTESPIFNQTLVLDKKNSLKFFS